MTAFHAHLGEAHTALWPAMLQLRFERRVGGSRLVQAEHRGPLRVQRPLYPEGPDCAHVYVLHPPGGLVSGDRLGITATVAASAHALLTTPGAGRVYRARGDGSRQRQSVSLQVAAGAALEWLPQPTIVFDGAQAALCTDVELAAGAAFIGWELLCLGRSAGAQPFQRGEVLQEWRVRRDGRPLLRERLVLRGGETLLAAPWGLRGHTVYGTLLAVLPEHTPAEHIVNTLRDDIDEGDAAALAITAMRGLLLARYLGDSVERGHVLFERCWQRLRPLVCGRPAHRPRIWNT